MTRFLLLPGACHGGWWFEPVAELLRAAGHEAQAVTLTGLDGDRSVPVNLDTHVEQVGALLETGPAVLVGHSYAGTVQTCVADRWPDSVPALLYLDAFVPADGDSCWSMTNDSQRAWYLSGTTATGLGLEPLPFFDERTVPHPIGTLLQAARQTGAWERVPVKHYAVALDPTWVPDSPFVAVADRLRSDPGWTVTDLPLTHNVLRTGPQAVVELALGL